MDSSLLIELVKQQPTNGPPTTMTIVTMSPMTRPDKDPNTDNDNDGKHDIMAGVDDEEQNNNEHKLKTMMKMSVQMSTKTS
jgi:hypothetical protein